MIAKALHSLKSDLDRAIFYWIVFMLCSMFIFLFFHLSMSSSVGVTFIDSKNNLSTNLTVFVIGICMIVIFMANNFYVKKKSKELAIMLVCGGTFLQLAEFLLIQTGVLLLCSIPFGIALGYFLFPVIELLLYYTTMQQIVISFQQSAIVATTIIIVFEILWCTFLNLGYAYRNSIQSLLHGEKIITESSIRLNIEIPFLKHVFLILYIGCAALLYLLQNDNITGMVISGILGTIGMYGCIGKYVIPYIDKKNHEVWVEDLDKVVYLGFLREDIKLMKSQIFLFVFTAILMLTMMAASIGDIIDTSLSLLSYFVMTLLLALSLMFRFSSEVVGRKRHFLSLERIGYVKEIQKKIIKKELLSFYGFVIIVSFIYIINILIVLMLNHLISFDMSLLILLFFLLPLLLSGGFNYLYYRNAILK